jgi:hypothetical protein
MSPGYGLEEEIFVAECLRASHDAATGFTAAGTG